MAEEQAEEGVVSLGERYAYLEKRASSDWDAWNIPFAEHRNFFESFRKDGDFDMLVDVTAIDWNKDKPRFTVVYHFYSTVHHTYLRLAVNCPNCEEPAVPTISDLWPAADWHERETFDMFGIRFDKHPDLRRILMWDEYPYYPLRKEFPLAGIETELPAADVAEETGASVLAAPMMGGPFTAPQSGHMSDREPRAKDQSWTEKKPQPGQKG